MSSPGYRASGPPGGPARGKGDPFGATEYHTGLPWLLSLRRQKLKLLRSEIDISGAKSVI
jgi:hypothetical protein